MVGIHQRAGNFANRKFKSNRMFITYLATNSAFHTTLSEARIGNFGVYLPWRCGGFN
jgi:hypothetical protein